MNYYSRSRTLIHFSGHIFELARKLADAVSLTSIVASNNHYCRFVTVGPVEALSLGSGANVVQKEKKLVNAICPVMVFWIPRAGFNVCSHQVLDLAGGGV